MVTLGNIVKGGGLGGKQRTNKEIRKVRISEKVVLGLL